ncbi:MAG: SbcC/MukB-like Walker B domain-containing protein [Lacisediminihabitans sp.]
MQRHQDGTWRPASRPASGGERVLAASVPLFAAAASHYASAGNPNAPRLVLLDEAFAGVDDRSRATYPEIPGIAIANLFRLPGADAVHVEHWTWDGTTRERVSDPGMTAIEIAPPEEWSENTLALDLGDPA